MNELKKPLAIRFNHAHSQKVAAENGDSALSVE